MRADLKELIEAKKGEAKRKVPVPTEEQEQRKLAQWLDLHRILWCHVPNGGQRNRIVAAKLKGQGTKKGVPDILIFDRPPKRQGCVGVAIELKREKGGTVSREQKQWIVDLNDRMWAAVVCHGADDAISFLESMGFGRRGGAQ